MELKQILKIKTIKYIFVMLVTYFLLCGILSYLMGEQLYIRGSIGNLEFSKQEKYSIELVSDTFVEQKFISKIDIINEFSVVFGTYGRNNTSDLKIQLLDNTENIVLYEKNIPSYDILDGQQYVIKLDNPILNTYNHELCIKISSLDATVGNAVSPVIGFSKDNSDVGVFYQNGELIPEYSLCFSITGIDRVWTGMHYKKVVFVGSILLIVISLYISIKYHNGKSVAILNLLFNFKKYNFLMKQLISRDFKTKYKRSVLGILWSFLNPFLTMLVQYVVFSTIFESDIKYYHIYLLIGIISFNFFSEVCNMCMMSILSNSSLITKVYIPKYIYPFTRAVSSSINFLISLIPLFLMIIFSGLPFSKSYILIIFPMLCLFMFSFGIGMILCTSMVFFRDTQFLWGIFSMLWMYMTPLFYPISIIPKNLRFFLEINPLYNFVTFFRICVIQGISPEPRQYVTCILMAVITLCIGLLVFKKNQDKFVLNI